MRDELVGPGGELSARVGGLLHHACAKPVADHCERSFRFALLLAELDGIELDTEALYVGVLLHDLGLSPDYQDEMRFEVRGANVARDLARSWGWGGERSANVWDIAALHTSRELALHKSPETRYANRGISADIRGTGLEGVDVADLRDVLDAWPRAGFPDAFAAALVGEVRAHPGTTRMTWLEHIAVAAVEGYEQFDFLASLRASDDFV
jgi:hypothetical protein